MQSNSSSDQRLLKNLFPQLTPQQSPRFLGYLAIGVGLSVFTAACRRNSSVEMDFEIEEC